MSKQIFQHGEVLLVEVGTMPAGSRKPATKYIVAHSESGHHHILESKTEFEVLTFEGEQFIRLFGEAELVHKKTHDKHRTLKIKPGIFKVLHKHEYDPWSKIIKKVQD